LKDQIAAVDKEHSTQGNRFHYLAVAPTFSRSSFANWAKRTSRRSNGNWTRVIVAKPFGHDLESAIQLNKS